MARIFGRPSASYQTVLANIPATAHPRFRLGMVPPLWKACLRYMVDPVGAVAQMAKETNWGNFHGDDPDPHRVVWWFFNPAGLKIYQHGKWPETKDDLPFAHTIFPNWETGTTAQVQHLRAYGGWPLPDGDLNVDPRWPWVAPRFLGAGLENWSELGGPNRWAPSLTYGTEIEALMLRLVAKAAGS